MPCSGSSSRTGTRCSRTSQGRCGCTTSGSCPATVCRSSSPPTTSAGVASPTGTSSHHDENEQERRVKVRPSVKKMCEKDRKSTRLNSSHLGISYAVFCLKKKKKNNN